MPTSTPMKAATSAAIGMVASNIIPWESMRTAVVKAPTPNRAP